MKKHSGVVLMEVSIQTVVMEVPLDPKKVVRGVLRRLEIVMG